MNAEADLTLATDPLATRSNATVYLVDDDEGALRSLAWLVRSEGYEIESYTSAWDFLDAYDQTKHGCLILDVRMSEMNGLQLQEELRARGQQIPIVFVTAHGDIPTSVRAIKGGAIDFLEKPVDEGVLLDRVHAAIQRDAEMRRVAALSDEVTVRLGRLTEREMDVLALLYDGFTTKQIAAQLGFSNQTAARHRVRVLLKMEVDNEVDLVRLLANHPVWRDRRSQPASE